MIDKVLGFITDRLNMALRNQFRSDTPRVVMGWVGGVPSTAFESRIILSLANLEQEARTQTTNHPGGGGPQPPTINLFVLVAANFGDNYAETLEFLSAAVMFFQSSPVMTPANSPDLPANIEKLTIEFVNLSFQDLNDLWTVRGSLYLPSFVLKLTPVAMDMVRIQDLVRPVPRSAPSSDSRD